MSSMHKKCFENNTKNQIKKWLWYQMVTCLQFFWRYVFLSCLISIFFYFTNGFWEKCSDRVTFSGRTGVRNQIRLNCCSYELSNVNFGNHELSNSSQASVLPAVNYQTSNFVSLNCQTSFWHTPWAVKRQFWRLRAVIRKIWQLRPIKRPFWQLWAVKLHSSLKFASCELSNVNFGNYELSNNSQASNLTALWTEKRQFW